MRKPLPRLGLCVAAAALGTLALAAPTNEDELLKDEKHRLEQANKTYDGGAKAGSGLNMVAVGHNDLGGRGFNGDVWTHEGYAYVGHWGFADWATGNDRFCPAEPDSGVAVLDARDPAHPVRVATLQNPPGTSAEDVVVYTAKYGPYAGRDIAVSGIQYCGGSRYDVGADRGLMLWDVTQPADPVQIGYLNTGCCTRGIHEFEVAHATTCGRSTPTRRCRRVGTPTPRRPAATATRTATAISA